MVDVGDTCHGDERIVVEEPANDRIDTRVVELVDLPLLEIGVAALPANEIPDDHESNDAERGCRAPVDDWIAEKEILHDF